MAYLLKDLSLKTLVTQAAHGFVVGDVLYNNNGTYAKAKADAIGTSYVAGVVEVVATDTFLLVSGGAVTLVGLTAVSQYYLSAATAGAITTTKPSASGHFIVPVLVSGTSTDAQIFIGAPSDAAFGGLLVSSLTITQGTITSDAQNISGTVTWNNGAVTFTGWKLNVTNTASSGTSMLMDLQTDSISRFAVRASGTTLITRQAADTSGSAITQLKRGTTGDATAAVASGDQLAQNNFQGWNGSAFVGGAQFRVATDETFTGSANGAHIELYTVPITTTALSLTLLVKSIASGSFLAFGSATSAFPALKRSGTELHVRLADDSAFTSIVSAQQVLTQGTITTDVPGINQSVTWNNAAVSFRGWQLAVTDTASASASRLISITRSGNDHFVVDNIGRLQLFHHSANTSGGSMTLFKRGTTGDITAAISADTTMGIFGTRGWNGTAFHSDASGMQVLSDEAFTGTNGGTRVEIRTVTPGTASNGAFAKFQSSALTLQSGCRLVVTRGTLTADAPSIDITETWNNVAVAFTGIKLNATNTTSSTASLLINLQVDSVSRFIVGRSGFTQINRQEADTTGSGFVLSKRGTTGSATAAIASGDAITSMDSAGWDGTTTATCASIRLFALETFTSIAHGCRFLFILPDVGGVTNSTRMELRATGLNLSNGCAFSVTHGTITTNLNTISGSVTWNNAAVSFNAISFTVTDTASAASSLILLLGTTVAPMFKVAKTGLVSISSPGVVAAVPTTSQVRLSVGAYASPNVVQVQGNGTADNTPAFSIFRSGNREAILAVVGTTLYISNTGGVANHTDTNCSTAPHISLTSLGSFVLTTGTIASAIQTLDSSVTWNNVAVAFTGWKLNVTNTTSSTSSLLINLQVGGVSKFAVDVSGNLKITAAATPTSLVGGVVLANGTAASADPTTAFAIWSLAGEFQYRASAASEGAGQTNRVHNRAEQVTGAGTAYTLTGATARVDFGTTDAEVVLPTAGTYLVLACVSFIGDAAGAGDSLRAKLRNSTDVTDVGAEKLATMSTNSGRVVIILDEVVTVTATKTIQIFGHNATSARGSVESTTTTIKYVRLS